MGQNNDKIGIRVIGNDIKQKEQIIKKINKYIKNKIHYDFSKLNEDEIELFYLSSFDVIILILNVSEDLDGLYSLKNRLLSLMSLRDTPVCIIYENNTADKNNLSLTFSQKNDILQVKNFTQVLILEINFHNKEDVMYRIYKIIKWMERIVIKKYYK